jgi:[ribosomal protein S18]-alanine N-acetyltransferase
MSAVTIIDATPAHAAVIATLYAKTVGAENAPDDGEGWSAEWVARILALPGAVAALALAQDQEPIGFALSLPAGEALDIAAIGVVGARRRTGVASALLRRMEEQARAHDAQRLMLEVAEDNAAARAFYATSGFVECGRRRSYYRARPGGVPRDALVFSKAL